jgi:hypothetical protein
VAFDKAVELRPCGDDRRGGDDDLAELFRPASG